MGGAPKLNETKVEDLDDLDPPYIAYTGIDYRPGQNPAPKVMVEDIVAIFVEDPFDCAVRCNDDDLCNSAAFYGNNPVGSWPQGLTCLLRVISVPCDVPDDYEQAEQTKTILLIAQDEDLCEEATTIIPVVPLGGTAVNSSEPLEAPLMGSPMDAEPLEVDPMLAPVDAPDDASAPAEGSIAAIPAAAPLPSAEPVPTPPATSTPPSDGLIRNFDVSTVPNVPVDPAPKPPTPSPNLPPITSSSSDAVEPAAQPAGVGIGDNDDYALGALPPRADLLNLESSDAVGLCVTIGGLAAASAVLFFLA